MPELVAVAPRARAGRGLKPARAADLDPRQDVAPRARAGRGLKPVRNAVHRRHPGSPRARARGAD